MVWKTNQRRDKQARWEFQEDSRVHMRVREYSKQYEQYEDTWYPVTCWVYEYTVHT